MLPGITSTGMPAASCTAERRREGGGGEGQQTREEAAQQAAERAGTTGGQGSPPPTRPGGGRGGRHCETASSVSGRVSGARPYLREQQVELLDGGHRGRLLPRRQGLQQHSQQRAVKGGHRGQPAGNGTAEQRRGRTRPDKTGAGTLRSTGGSTCIVWAGGAPAP